MMIEAAVNEGIKNPLDLDLVGSSFGQWTRLGLPIDPESRINSTIGQWTPLHERLMRLGHLEDVELNRYLFYAGYRSDEQAKALGVLRQTIDLRVRDIERPSLVASLRRVFSEPTRMPLGMDLAVSILRDFINGSTPAEVAIETGFRPRLLADKRLALLAAGFPIPVLPEIPAQTRPLWRELTDPSKYKRLKDAIRDAGRNPPKSLGPFFRRLVIMESFEEESDVAHRTKSFHDPDGNLRIQHYYFLKRSEVARFEELLNKRPSVLRVDHSIDGLLDIINTGRDIFWSRLQPPTIRYILERAAEELGVPAGTITVQHLRHRLKSLNGRSLERLYKHAIQDPERGEKDAVSFILEKSRISMTSEDVISRLREERQVFWDRVPADEIRAILQMAADEIGMPIGTMGYTEIGRGKLLFLNNHSLGGLYGYFYRHPERGDQNTIAFMFEKVGITITANDVVFQIKRDRSVYWARVPWEERKKVGEYAAEELSLPTNLLGGGEYRRHFSFLNGHTLSGFINYCLTQDPEKRDDENTMQFISRMCGFTEPTHPTRLGPRAEFRTRLGSRVEFRRQQMQILFDQFLQNVGMVENPTIESLLPWIGQIARLYGLYGNTFFDMTRDNIQSEVVIYLGDKLQDGELFNQSTILAGLHRHLEEILSGVINRRYREISLQAPLLGGVGSLEGVLQSASRQ